MILHTHHPHLAHEEKQGEEKCFQNGSFSESGCLEDEPQQSVTVCYFVRGGSHPNQQMSTGVACRLYSEIRVIDN